MSNDYVQALAAGNFSAAIKSLDVQLKQAQAKNAASSLPQLHCNKAFCYEQLQLHRRALKVRPLCHCRQRFCELRKLQTPFMQEYDEAINTSSNTDPECTRALVQRGLLLHKLKNGAVSTCLGCDKFCSSYAPDLSRGESNLTSMCTV